MADALSRRSYEEDSSTHSISVMKLAWLSEVLESYQGDNAVTKLAEGLTIIPDSLPNYFFTGGLLRYKGRVYIGSSGGLRQKLIACFHDSHLGRHSGNLGTYQRLKGSFFWPRMKREVEKWVQQCDVCMRSKVENCKTPGLLQPLPIPEQAWQHILMDFIEGLPKSQGYEGILVVIDRFTKYCHLLALPSKYTAQSVANMYFDNIYKLHGLPLSIVSDRDRLFTSLFW